jgi:hypothetical protein
METENTNEERISLVYGYACLYYSLNKADIKELTLTFIESRYPRELIRHLQEKRGYTVEERFPGIYIVSGDVLPIQIIDSRKLSGEENLWLKSLNKEHDRFTIARIDKEISKMGKIARLQAYIYAIISANPEAAEEAIKMGSKFEEVMERTGITAKLEAKAHARGMAEGKTEVARNALAQGLEPGFVQKITGLDIQTITSLK